MITTGGLLCIRDKQILKLIYWCCLCITPNGLLTAFYLLKFMLPMFLKDRLLVCWSWIWCNTVLWGIGIVADGHILDTRCTLRFGLLFKDTWCSCWKWCNASSYELFAGCITGDSTHFNMLMGFSLCRLLSRLHQKFKLIQLSFGWEMSSLSPLIFLRLNLHLKGLIKIIF